MKPRFIKEVYMPTKVRVNLANRLELQELPGVGPREADAIVKFRSEHGPIHDERQLASILGGQPTAESLSARADFSPADATAPEAPGA
jgi:competence ComEA-like helix-hairpin-helix protein